MPEQMSAAKTQRVLSCVLCQQRKVKCDRAFPCANCTKAGARCVPAATLAPRPRRRRFPERELLDRLRYYEDLLRRHSIRFEPLHYATVEHDSQDPRYSEQPADTCSEPTTSETSRQSSQKPAVKSEPVSLWRALSEKTEHIEDGDDDGDTDESDIDVLGENRGLLDEKPTFRKSVIRKAWKRTYENETDDHLLFASPQVTVDLSPLHPTQAKILKLWQIYLDNVDPLLKLTHSPTLQARIIDAVGDTTNLSPNLEALIFGIYCMSILSLDDETCRSLFGLPRKDLLSSYKFACRQALANCRVMKSSDRDCLTALFFFLVAVRSETDPRSLSTMLGMAVRVAKRMGIHDESSYARFPPLEAEMRRRLWWSIVHFDNRICEMFDFENSSLTPDWDCDTLLNINDFEIRPEMKARPEPHEKPTEAIFTVVRSELGDFVRNSPYHIDFINPNLKALIKEHAGTTDLHGGSGTLERMIQDKYLAFCNPENPLQFMTIWWTRGYIAKMRLLEHFWKSSRSTVEVSDLERIEIISHTLAMLESDTKLMGSPLTKGFRWLVDFHFPFPAYMHLLQDLKTRPNEAYAEKSWRTMDENFGTRVKNGTKRDNPLMVVFAGMVFQAWAAREALLKQQGADAKTPLIVSEMMRKPDLASPTLIPNDGSQHAGSAGGFTMGEPPLPMGLDQSMTYGTGAPSFMLSTPWSSWPYQQQNRLDLEAHSLDWTSIDWNSVLRSE